MLVMYLIALSLVAVEWYRTKDAFINHGDTAFKVLLQLIDFEHANLAANLYISIAFDVMITMADCVMVRVNLPDTHISYRT